MAWRVSPLTDIFLTGTKLMFIIGCPVSGILNTRAKFEVWARVIQVEMNFLKKTITPEHKIQGDSLCDLDFEGLKSLGITSIGQRISILKHIYQVKLAHDVPIGAHQYVPPCEYFCPFFCAAPTKNRQLRVPNLPKI